MSRGGDADGCVPLYLAIVPVDEEAVTAGRRPLETHGSWPDYEGLTTDRYGVCVGRPVVRDVHQCAVRDESGNVRRPIRSSGVAAGDTPAVRRAATPSVSGASEATA